VLEPAFSSLKDFFSGTFLVSRFLPSFFFVLLNALLIALAGTGIEAALGYAEEHLKMADIGNAVAIATLIAIVVAFTLSPLLPAFTLLLEGKPLPGKWRAALTASTRERSGDVAAQADAYRNYVAAAKGLHRGHIDRFTRAIAARPADSMAGSAVDEAKLSVEAAGRAAAAVQTKADSDAFDGEALISAAEALKDAGDRLEAALKSYPKPDALTDAATAGQRKTAAALQAAQRQYSKLLGVAVTGGTALLRKTETRAERLAVATDPQPTRFANLRAQIQDYCRRVYKLEYEYVWPRLRLVIDAEEKKSASIDDAQAQLDFSLMMLALLLASAIAWAIWLIATFDRPATILAGGIAAPPLIAFFYNVVLESQRKLNEITQAAIDRYRLKLLEELKVPAPTNYQEELKSWRTVQAIASGYVPAESSTINAGYTYKT
jgi:uncharacterized RDD family membrane protein YckC